MVEHVGKCYVGQTLQKIERRHAQHMFGTSVFDKILQSNPHGFTRSVIDKRTFKAEVTTTKEKAKLSADAQEWMNEREIHYIHVHGAYSNATGFNGTSGGQLGRDQAFYEAQLLAREREWELRIRALRFYKEQNGDLLVPATFAFTEKNCSDLTLVGYKLGRVVSCIRSGDITVSDEERQTLDGMGFVWDVPKYERELRIRALRFYKEQNGDLLVPQSCQLVHPSDPQLDGYKLGKVVSNLRTRDITVSDEERKTLDGMGFVWDVSKYEWEVRRMPALRFYKVKFGNLLVPCRFVFTEENCSDLTLVGYKLGTVVGSIRKGLIIVSDERRNTLDGMGFVWDVSKYEWEVRRMPALRFYKVKFGNLLVPCRFVFTEENCSDLTLVGYKLGTAVTRIRTGNISVSDERRNTLDAMGFVWDAS